MLKYVLFATMLASASTYTADGAMIPRAARARPSPLRSHHTRRVIARQGDGLGVTTRRLSVRALPSESAHRLGITGIGDTVRILQPEPENKYLNVVLTSGDGGWVLACRVRRLVASTTRLMVAPLRGGSHIAAWGKPAPVQLSTGPCAAAGSGANGAVAPDPQTDLRKNRIDIPTSYHPVTFDDLLALPWRNLPRRRSHWSAADSIQITQFEGAPVSLEGYLVDVKEEGPEATNCEGATSDWHDWHMWLVRTTHEVAAHDRSRAIVVEATPRVRALPIQWTLTELRSIIHAGQPVRVSGWLLWDPDHPDQVGKSRGSTWEIHPVTRLEVQQHARWHVLPLP